MTNLRDSRKRSSAVLFLATLLLSTFGFLSSASAQTKPASTSPSKKIVFLGDSLTEGYGITQSEAYPALIAKKIEGKGLNWKVVNAGISGSTSASGPQRATWQLKSKPDILFLALGANDGLRGLSTTEMKKNLEKVIEMALREKVKVVLAGMQMPPNYGAAYTKDFAKVFVDLQKQYKLDFVPFLLDGVAGDSKLNLADGVHPNKEGHKIMAEKIWKHLEPLLEKQP